MNKNYKENLKKRGINETKKRIDYKEYKVKENKELLKYLIENLQFSRNNAKNLLSHNLVAIDGAPVSQYNFLLSVGDTLIISKTPIKRENRSNLPIIYEDDEIIVIDKPEGLLSVASDKEKKATCYRIIMDYVQAKNKNNRVFIVHRLDKETSGVLMFVKKEDLRDELQAKWNDIVKKRGYFAICEGVFNKKEGRVVNYLKKNNLDLMVLTSKDDKNAQKCITNYKVIKENTKYSLVDVNLETGRKNQIRVTFGSMKHFVLGDDKYGEPENPLNRLCLHAYELSFIHPKSGKLYTFKSKMPNNFNNLFNK